MFKFFKRKNDDLWIISVKNLKKQKTEQCKFLTREEIKREILRKDADGEDYAKFTERRIEKQDKKDLKRQGYTVREDKYVDGRRDIIIYW